MDGTKQYEGNGCTRFVALAFQQDDRPYSWSGIEETAERAYESLCQDICEGDPEDSSLFRIYVFDLKDAIKRTVEDFSAAGATYVSEQAPALTEKEKAAIVLDEMAKSDDGKVNNRNTDMALTDLLRYVAYLEQDRELLMDQVDKLVEANKLAVKQITQLDRGRERLEAEINNLMHTYKPSRLEIADHKGE